MASKKNKYDLAHLRNLSRYSAEVEAIYREAVKEAAKLASTVHTPMGEDMFSFADYPQTKKRIDALLAKYRKDMMKVLVNGVDAEWTLANNKNSEIARQVFGKKADTLTDEQKRQYFTNNDTAREAFKGRSVNGMNLSDRVWNFAGSFRKEIEMGVDLGLRKGQSASEMARDLQKFLKHPDELYRRVRDEHGVLKLSQAAKDFHPGRGVYRSSYKNALRLAITETNMAYRIADWERWQTMDFVVGIRIQLSGNHTCLGSDGLPHPFKDICDELAGDYPKSFKWTGWHPQCRCNAVPILKTVQERKADMKARLAGGKASKDSVNAVKKLPRAFNEWLERNKDRIAGAKSQPYFIRDNAAAVDKIISGVLPENMVPATPTVPIAERAQMRHDARTAEQIADIRRRWTLREAEIRHAARTQEQIEAIKNAWNERKELFRDNGNTSEQKSHIYNSKEIQEFPLSKEDRVRVRNNAIERGVKHLDIPEAEAKVLCEAINDFSCGWDEEIRKFQTGKLTAPIKDGHTMDEIAKKAGYVEEFIKKSPKWNGGTTFRGMAVDDKTLESFKNMLKNGGELDMRGSSSWSTSESISEGYALDNSEKFPNMVIFECEKRQNGTSISHVSHFAGECEVLCSSKSRYRVVEILDGKTKFHRKGKNITIIKVEPV
ncbi:MAG: hypothetical protein NC324_03145 [Bacteroides sp.]|nr:hypothetical protein [Bacteroides sp.]